MSNQIEQTLSRHRGERWVQEAKRQAKAYQRSVRMSQLSEKAGAFYLTSKGSVVRFIALKDSETACLQWADGRLGEISAEQLVSWQELNEETMKQLNPKQWTQFQLHLLKKQKRRVNQQRLLPENRQLILQGLDLAIQAIQNSQNPNNKW